MTRNQIQFYFRGAVRTLTVSSPTRTVLQYLREDIGAVGTKEGCGEGDCGACTVVIGERVGDRLELAAVNACIRFLPSLDGKALFTVEDLAAGGVLHPVQQAMVDCHGSQCGFCTPGFVMSLWAMYENHPHCPSQEAMQDTLSGNLCRCTGYRPIMDAARAAYASPRVELQRGPIAAALEALRELPVLEGREGDARYAAPRTLADLLERRARAPQARLVAGATDVGLWVTKQLRDPGEVIFVGGVAELRTVSNDGAWLEIGAAVPLERAFEELALLHPAWDGLRRRFASGPVRNAGTLGGNVANGSPIGDSMPPLIAAGATVVLASVGGERELALEDFYLAYQRTALAPDEILCRVRIPLPSPEAGRHFAIYKVSKRFDQDISAVCAGFGLTVTDGTIRTARLGFGGMAAVPRRAASAEAALIGAPFCAASFEAAAAAVAADFTPLSDVRASADYRLTVAANLLRRFWLEIGTALPVSIEALEATP
ncbi:xanthine dehydrogenase small subunit [Paludibacterium yongneupense]|uniref:xanthine dehydrogenase small subunit n=1 Tax=Paludibacterium yongneupense TaxID=400061 RepID=UPI0004249819|nr:xanthine dehydrogenase small subunit [Paludibacterium yongneupense]